MGTYSFVKSVRRSQSDVSICHIRISGCVCYILFRYPWSGHLVKGSPWHTLLECVRRLQYLNHLFRNLCQGYEVRLWHIRFNQFQAVWINDAPCRRYFIQTKIACDQERKTAWLGENWTCVMFQSLVYTCPVFLKTNMIVWLSFPPRDGVKPWPEGQESLIRDPFWQKLSDFPVVGVIRAKV